MEKRRRGGVASVVCAVFLCLLCTPMAALAADPPADPAAQIDSSTPWGTPVLVSPNSGTQLFHYPRTTTLTWQPVTGAAGYQVERGYLSGSTWTTYPVVAVSGGNNAFYSFNFVGDQLGRWRVRAYKPGGVYTPWSAYWTFTYVTKAQMSVPILTSPYPNEVFHHYSRKVTLAWKMVPGALGYKVEIEYCNAAKTSCAPYTPVTRTGYLNSSYTFDFIGAQPGRWRVTTLGGSTYSNSLPSGWRWFSFTI